MIGHMSTKKSRMTPYQKITARQKEVRLININQYYRDNPGCSINQAVKYTPPNGESAALVCQYSKLRTELVIEGGQDEITQKDIHEYVYGEEPLKYRQRK